MGIKVTVSNHVRWASAVFTHRQEKWKKTYLSSDDSALLLGFLPLAVQTFLWPVHTNTQVTSQCWVSSFSQVDRRSSKNAQAPSATAVLDEYTEPALPFLGLLADLDWSSVAASVETWQTENSFYVFIYCQLYFSLDRWQIGWSQACFNPLSNILLIRHNPFTGWVVTNVWSVNLARHRQWAGNICYRCSAGCQMLF